MTKPTVVYTYAQYPYIEADAEGLKLSRQVLLLGSADNSSGRKWVGFALDQARQAQRVSGVDELVKTGTLRQVTAEKWDYQPLPSDELVLVPHVGEVMRVRFDRLEGRSSASPDSFFDEEHSVTVEVVGPRMKLLASSELHGEELQTTLTGELRFEELRCQVQVDEAGTTDAKNVGESTMGTKLTRVGTISCDGLAIDVNERQRSSWGWVDGALTRVESQTVNHHWQKDGRVYRFDQVVFELVVRNGARISFDVRGQVEREGMQVGHFDTEVELVSPGQFRHKRLLKIGKASHMLDESVVSESEQLPD